MREQARSRKSAIDGPRRRLGLHDPLAALAAQLGTDMADDLEAGPHVLQHLCNIFAEWPQLAAAIGAGFVVRQVAQHFARQMLGQRTARGLSGSGVLSRHRSGLLFRGAVGFELFELQLQLFDLTEDFFALGSEEHALELLDDQLEVRDLACARAQRRGVLFVLCSQQRLDGFKIERVKVRQRGGEHERSMPRIEAA